MKKRQLSKVLGLIVVCVLIVACVASLASCSGQKKDTLIVAYSNFSSKFSPFFASSSYDVDVYSMTQVSLLASDRGGNIINNGIEGETIKYNGTDYTYYGLGDLTITQNKDGGGNVTSVDYKIQIRTGDKTVKFSDGQPLTIKDVLFSMYVLSDMDYDGSTTFFSLPIEGMTEWRTNLSTAVYEAWLAKADAILATFSDEIIQYDDDDNPIYKKDRDGNVVKDDLGNPVYDYTAGYVYTESEAYTKAEFDSLVGAIESLNGGWKALAIDIVNYCVSNYSGTVYMDPEEKLSDAAYFKMSEVALGMGMWGFGGYNDDGKFEDSDGNEYTLVGDDVPTIADYAACLKNAYGGNLAKAASVEAASGDFESYAATVVEPWVAEVGQADMGETKINSISGITYSLEEGWVNVRTTEFSATTVYQLPIAVAPMHYYGDTNKWDPANGSYGFTRGNLNGVRSKTTQPMGAGPYKFVSFSGGIVTFEANENYWEGAPKIKYVKFKEYSSDPDKLPALVKGEVDIATPSISKSVIGQIKEANGNKADLVVNDTVAVATDLVDFNGYGYIGMNADRVKVGTDKASVESKNLRRAFATLFAAYREYTVSSYYEERASVIQYPISNCSWAAPQPADAGYAIAFSKDVNGNAIYTADMNDEQKYAAAKTAAIGFFEAAGYTFNNGEATAPEGARTTYEAIIGGGGTGDHPTFALLNKVSEVLETIGITLQVTDKSTSSALFDMMEAGTADIFVAAWGGSSDPDMYQIYHSDNKTNSNHYHIADATLDAKIIEARKSDDKTFRKGVYKECLDIILDWAVEIPVYQRKECTVYKTATVNVGTITPDTTPYWTYLAEIHKVELK